MIYKKVVLISIILFLILAGVVYLTQRDGNKTEKFLNNQVPEVQKINVDFSKLPDKFPEDIPIEKGSKTTQNYNSTTPEGHFQATRTFVTSLSLDENYQIYEKFFQDNGWTIKATTNEPAYKMIAGGKDQKNILVAIDENKGPDKTKTVSISYSELK